MEDINITLTVSEEGLERILSIVSKYFESSVIQNKSFINIISLNKNGQESAYNRDGQEICIKPIDKQNVENKDKSIDLSIKENTTVHSAKSTPNSMIECPTVHSAENNNIISKNTGSNVTCTKSIVKCTSNNVKCTEEYSPVSKEFIIPTVDEIAKYIKETHSSVNPYKFFNYYEERGWKDGSGYTMDDWKAKVDSWTSRDRKSYKSAPVKVIPPFVPTEFDDGKN